VTSLSGGAHQFVRAGVRSHHLAFTGAGVPYSGGWRPVGAPEGGALLRREADSGEKHTLLELLFESANTDGLSTT
jgi:hypothetical protein